MKAKNFQLKPANIRSGLLFLLIGILCGCATQNKATISEQEKRTESQYSADSDSNPESLERLRQMEAQISRRIEEANKLPKKTFITPSTREVGYALYYTSVKRKIEEFGTDHFPVVDGKKLYGKLIVSVPIFQDGTIYEDGGGPVIEQSSGNPALDSYALRITRRAAPFEKIPENMRTGKMDVWVLIFSYNFLHTDDDKK